ncbi:hypothetical protein EVAR_96183_1 [Eumeta japonica]|uniref:Uncharacterized protein n=1 Tax=Eumeta variegata TaxID=151549 RepID=A0A4C1VJ72_EUMVA|nr:hypothetical protein EVAR_96183_1 [Eumeta japonica]
MQSFVGHRVTYASACPFDGPRVVSKALGIKKLQSGIIYSRGKGAGKPSLSGRSPPPMDTNNPGGITSALPTSWEGTGYLMEEGERSGRSVFAILAQKPKKVSQRPKFEISLDRGPAERPATVRDAFSRKLHPSVREREEEAERPAANKLQVSAVYFEIDDDFPPAPHRAPAVRLRRRPRRRVPGFMIGVFYFTRRTCRKITVYRG